MPYVSDHLEVVEETLSEVGANSQLRILVINKTDTTAGGNAVAGLLEQYPAAIVVSAKNGTGLDRLRDVLSTALADGSAMVGALG